MADATATLGDGVRAELLATARIAADNAHDRMQPREASEHWPASEGESVANAQRFYDLTVVEQFQQLVHDEFWDTTWPACPRHRNHPLWYSETQHAWCCPRDGAALAPLGGLAGLYARAT
jgi:hypothetical protein